MPFTHSSASKHCVPSVQRSTAAVQTLSMHLAPAPNDVQALSLWQPLTPESPVDTGTHCALPLRTLQTWLLGHPVIEQSGGGAVPASSGGGASCELEAHALLPVQEYPEGQSYAERHDHGTHAEV
jgi:hypothetical protein